MGNDDDDSGTEREQPPKIMKGKLARKLPSDSFSNSRNRPGTTRPCLESGIEDDNSIAKGAGDEVDNTATTKQKNMTWTERTHPLALVPRTSQSFCPSGPISTTWSRPSYSGRSKSYFSAIDGVTNLTPGLAQPKSEMRRVAWMGEREGEEGRGDKVRTDRR